MWLGDKRTEQNPPDDFRKTYVPKPQRSRMVAGKAMTQDFTSAKDGKVRTRKQEKRWTDQEGPARFTKDLFIGDPYESLKLREPMYSSFRKDGVFVEAPVGKGLLPWEQQAKSLRGGSQTVKAGDVPTEEER